MKNFIKSFFSLNKKISAWFDTFLHEEYRTFGTHYFDRTLVPVYLKDQQTVFDIGGGKHPNIDLEIKKSKRLKVIGFDIDEEELRQAPVGLYDQAIVADITKGIAIEEKADIIICRAILEHVKDTKSALFHMSELLKPEGKILIFVPCRNAFFSRINLLLDEKTKLKLLQLAFPEKMHRIGFKAYYDQTTPSDFKKTAEELNLNVEKSRIFWASRYFEVFFPVHVLWRFYQMLLRLFKAENFCETFIMVLEKPANRD